MTSTTQPNHMTTTYGGYDQFDTLVHPDHDGTFYPWKTPWAMLQQGQLILRSVSADDIVTVDIDRVQLWDVEHPSWCVPSKTCENTANVGAVTHRCGLRMIESKATTAKDAPEWEAHDFNTYVVMEEIADSEGRAGATLRVSFAGEIADGSFTASPEQLRHLARQLERAADKAISSQDTDYQPRR